VARVAEHLLDRAVLGHAPAVHHQHFLTCLGDHAQVVRHNDHRQIEVAPQSIKQLHNLSLDHHIQRGSRLIGHDQLRITRQRHRDHGALAHAAAVLMRILCRAPGWNSNQLQQLAHARIDLRVRPGHMQQNRLAHLIANRSHRVERIHRALEHHRQIAPAPFAKLVGRECKQILAIEQRLAASDSPSVRQQPQQRQHRSRFTAAALANDPKRLTALQRKADIFDRAQHHAIVGDELGGKVANVE